MRILGVDPGLRRTGYGVLETVGRRFRLVRAGVIHTRKEEPLPRRLATLHEGLSRVLRDLEPEAVAVEGLFHAHSTSSALLLGHVRGVILLAVSTSSLPIFEYSPREVKKAVVGSGRADKRQVQEMIRVLLRLDGSPGPPDAADALAVAICHAHTLALRSLLLRQAR